MKLNRIKILAITLCGTFAMVGCQNNGGPTSLEIEEAQPTTQALLGYGNHEYGTVVKQWGGIKISACAFVNNYGVYDDIGAAIKCERLQKTWLGSYWKNVDGQLSVNAYFTVNESNYAFAVKRQTECKYTSSLSTRAIRAGITVGTTGNSLTNWMDPNQYHLEFVATGNWLEQLDLYDFSSFYGMPNWRIPISVSTSLYNSLRQYDGIVAYCAGSRDGNQFRAVVTHNVSGKTICFPTGVTDNGYKICW